MSLLPEYAVLPEVFEATGDGACVNLRSVFELCLREGIVRNLHSGRCRHSLVQNLTALSPAGQKVFEFLDKSGRLISCPKALPKAPSTSEDWCREAIASRQHRDLSAIFAEKATAAVRAAKAVKVVRVIGSLRQGWVGCGGFERGRPAGPPLIQGLVVDHIRLGPGSSSVAVIAALVDVAPFGGLGLGGGRGVERHGRSLGGSGCEAESDQRDEDRLHGVSPGSGCRVGLSVRSVSVASVRDTQLITQ